MGALYRQTLKSGLSSYCDHCDFDYWLLNPLSPNIHIQIPQTDLHTIPLRISWENLTADQSIFSLVIIL